jgi:hypothetical protein
MILAVARPYPEKNITSLVKAFGECRPLRELANLVRCDLTILIYVVYFLLCSVCNDAIFCCVNF